MSCERVRPQLGPFLAGALDPEPAREVEEHLPGCLACGEELAALQALAEGLAAGAAEARAASPRWRRWLLGLAAAAALGALAGRVLLREEPARPEGGARAEARLDVRGQAIPLQVDTPRGRVRVAPGAAAPGSGAAFQVIVRPGEEGDVKQRGVLALGAGVAVVVAVSAGAVLFEPTGGGPAVRVEAGQQVLAGASPPEVRALPAAGPGSGEPERPGQPALAAEVARVSAERDQAAREREALREELARAREELAALQRGAAPAAPRGARLSWGRWAQEPALAQVDWVAGGGAARAVREAIPELLARLERGEQPSQEVLLRLAKENQKLVAIELEAHGKLPTHAPSNGAFTHPAVQANLIAAHLEQVGLPLSSAQELQVMRACQDYDQAWEQQEASWPVGTLALEKLLAEVRLKRALSTQLDGILGAEQRAALSAPEGRHLHTIDLYSPVLALIGVAAPLPVTSQEQAAAYLVQFAARWGLSPEQLGGELAGRWAQAALDRQAPVAPGHGSLFTVDQALQAGEAQLEVMRALRGRADLPEAAREALGADQGLAVPHLVRAP